MSRELSQTSIHVAIATKAYECDGSRCRRRRSRRQRGRSESDYPSALERSGLRAGLAEGNLIADPDNRLVPCVTAPGSAYSARSSSGADSSGTCCTMMIAAPWHHLQDTAPLGELSKASWYRHALYITWKEEANSYLQGSEQRLYTFSDETKIALRKFRLSTSRAKDPQAVICAHPLLSRRILFGRCHEN